MVQLKLLESRLKTEKEDRKKTEDEACKLLKGYKVKYDTILKNKDEKIQVMKEKMSNEHHKVRNLEAENQLILIELQTLKDDLRQSQEDANRTAVKTPIPAARKKQESECQTSPEKLKSRESRSAPCSPDLTTSKKMHALETEIARLKVELSDKEFEVNRARERATIARDINIGLREEKTEMEKKLKEANDALEEAQADAEEKVKEDIRQLKCKIRELESKLKDEQKSKEKLTNDMASLRRIAETKDQRIEKLNDELEDLREKWEIIRQEMKEEFDDEKSKLMEEIKRATRESTESNQELRRLRQKAKVLEENLKEVDKQAEEWHKAFTKKEFLFKELLQQKKKDDEEMIQMKKNFEKTERALAEEKDKKSDNTSRLIKRVKDLDEELEKERLRIEKMRKDLQHEHNEKEGLRKQNQSLVEELERVGSEANDAQDIHEILGEEIKMIKEEAARHITEICNQRTRAEKYKVALKNSEDQKEMLDVRLNSCLDEIDKMKKEHAKEVFKLEEMIRQYHQMQDATMVQMEKLERTKRPLIGISPRPVSAGIKSLSKTPREKAFSVNSAASPYGGVISITEYEKERDKSRKLEEKLRKKETELEEVKMQLKMAKVDHYHQQNLRRDADDISPSASAPPPPYPVAYRDGDNDSMDRGSSVSSVSTSASSEANTNIAVRGEVNIDGERYDFNHRVKSQHKKRNDQPHQHFRTSRPKTVHADVHQEIYYEEDEVYHGRDENRADNRAGEFTFSDSILEELHTGMSPRNNHN